MPITYEIDLVEKLVYVTFPQETDLKSSLEMMRTVAADKRLGEGFGILMDVRATRFIPSATEARAIATFASDQATFLHYPTAVVTSQRAQHEAGSTISIVAGLKRATVQVFYEVEEAKTWLRSLRRKGQLDPA